MKYCTTIKHNIAWRYLITGNSVWKVASEKYYETISCYKRTSTICTNLKKKIASKY